MGILVILGAGFVSLLGLGFFALGRGFKRITARPASAPRAVGAVACVGGMAALGAMGAVVLAGFAALFIGMTVLEHGPVRSVEIVRADEALDGRVSAADSQLWHGELSQRYPVHALVEVRGTPDLAKLERWLARETDGNVELVDARQRADDYGSFSDRRTVLDFGLRVSRRDLRRFERDFERELPFFDLPHGVRFEVREP